MQGISINEITQPIAFKLFTSLKNLAGLPYGIIFNSMLRVGERLLGNT
jgi:hypothetical protein